MSVAEGRPVAERIAVVLATRLNALASDAGQLTGYKSCIRKKLRESYSIQHLLPVLEAEYPKRNAELDCTGNPPRLGWDLLFNIMIHVNPSQNDPTPIDEYNLTAHADVVRVVCDIQLHDTTKAWQTFDGLAKNANWGDVEEIEPDGGPGGIIVPLAVSYRVHETDPYRLG